MAILAAAWLGVAGCWGVLHSEDGAAQQTRQTRRPLPSPEALAKLPPDGGPDYNRLVFEKSPYLLQHAGNPVNWYPWGEAAFAKAKKEDKPVFLSVGYATCHWCHVMERESFEDAKVAEILNRHFVAVKVDREERPDIDNIYMEVCQAMTGSGGWPLTIIMTPEKVPFFAGTYFPKEERFGRPGIVQILTQLAEFWRQEPGKVQAAASEASWFLQKQAERQEAGEPLGTATLEAGFNELRRRYDAEHGGFGGAPKFPTPHDFTFLLRSWRRTGNPAALEMAGNSLRKMAAGGIHDHLGGGFHRYATDGEWLVPHFEKMLYDQALLACAYVEMHQVDGTGLYGEMARDIFRYVLRDMTAPEGGFYSAEDADSAGLEGQFYVWRPEEILKVLGPEKGGRFNRFYGVTEAGNFHEPHGPEKHSILHTALTEAEFAAQEGLTPTALKNELAESRAALFAVREQRVHPFKDDKILTDWNGLMIAALAKGAQALGEPEYAVAARRAADFLLKNMRDDRGFLLHRYRQSAAAIPAHLDDYAFLVLGLLELYEAVLDPRYLEEALRLSAEMTARFWDEKQGGLFFTAADAEKLLIRKKEFYDGAVPAGNSVAVLCYLRLARMTGNAAWEERARKILAACAAEVGRAPAAHAQWLVALDFAIGPTQEIIIAGNRDDELTRELFSGVRRSFLPNKVLLFHPAAGEEKPRIEKIAEFIRAQTPIAGKAAAYVCENSACKLPTSDPRKLMELLGIE